MIPAGSKKYFFTVELTGIGPTEESAWLDATEAFNQDPGVCTNKRFITEESGTGIGEFKSPEMDGL